MPTGLIARRGGSKMIIPRHCSSVVQKLRVPPRPLRTIRGVIRGDTSTLLQGNYTHCYSFPKLSLIGIFKCSKCSSSKTAKTRRVILSYISYIHR